jgi:hypothetical protein
MGFALAALGLVVTPPAARELSSAEIAAIFFVLAIGFFKSNSALAGLALIAGMLVELRPGAPLIYALTQVALASIAALITDVLPRRVRVGALLVTTSVLVTALCWGFREALPEGPFQYESAARTCYEIARRFDRNTWIIVSPTQELAIIYGQGWHVELTTFVNSFSKKEVSDPAFRFPYIAPDVFIFIENEPLVPSIHHNDVTRLARIDVVNSMDPAVLAYGTVLGRALIEFEAADIIAGYSRFHSDISTFYRDSQITVYRVSKQYSTSASDYQRDWIIPGRTRGRNEIHTVASESAGTTFKCKIRRSSSFMPCSFLSLHAGANF